MEQFLVHSLYDLSHFPSHNELSIDKIKQFFSFTIRWISRWILNSFLSYEFVMGSQVESHRLNSWNYKNVACVIVEAYSSYLHKSNRAHHKFADKKINHPAIAFCKSMNFRWWWHRDARKILDWRNNINKTSTTKPNIEILWCVGSCILLFAVTLLLYVCIGYSVFHAERMKTKVPARSISSNT